MSNTALWIFTYIILFYFLSHWSAIAMLRGKYIALYAYINKGKLKINDLGNYLKNFEE